MGQAYRRDIRPCSMEGDVAVGVSRISFGAPADALLLPAASGEFLAKKSAVHFN
jgi:hypothetical protein